MAQINTNVTAARANCTGIGTGLSPSLSSCLSLPIRLAQEPFESIVDGPGLRLVIFCQGCPHHCPGCHNPQTHLQVGGKAHDLASFLPLYRQNHLLAGVTFTGGEPFEQGLPLAQFAAQIKAWGGDVITYSGYTLPRLQALAAHDAGKAALLAQTDLLIDGPYVQQERSLELPFRGSRNQRLLALSPQGAKLLAQIAAIGGSS